MKNKKLVSIVFISWNLPSAKETKTKNIDIIIALIVVASTGSTLLNPIFPRIVTKAAVIAERRANIIQIKFSIIF